ncbi:MAG: RAD55 family ATPase [Haloferacaceae archaeon]
MTEMLSTGVEALDRRLDGGLPVGSLLALVAPPASQSEALIHDLMDERPTLYVTTIRQREAVEAELVADDHDAEVVVTHAGGTASMDSEFLKEVTGNRTHALGSGDDRLLDDVYEAVERVDRPMNVVVDPANPLERTDKRRAYQEVPNRLKATLVETGGLGVVHCISSVEVPALRETTLTVADVVWDLDVVEGSDSVEHQLLVPKNRRGTVVLEETTLVFEPHIHVDDSWNI